MWDPSYEGSVRLCIHLEVYTKHYSNFFELNSLPTIHNKECKPHLKFFMFTWGQRALWDGDNLVLLIWYKYNYYLIICYQAGCRKKPFMFLNDHLIGFFTSLETYFLVGRNLVLAGKSWWLKVCASYYYLWLCKNFVIEYIDSNVYNLCMTQPSTISYSRSW